MKLTGILVWNKDFPENNGDLVHPDAISFPSTLPVTVEFDKEDRIGDARPYTDKDGNIRVDMDLQDGQGVIDFLDLTPAIGGVIGERNGNTIMSFSIKEVSICSTPNQDERIKSLREQTSVKPIPANRLTIEFWGECIKQSPKAMNQFLDFIDNYKKENDWNKLFNGGVSLGRFTHSHNAPHTEAPKYHDLPYAMQIGIFFDWLYKVDDVLPPSYNDNMTYQIKAILKRIETKLNKKP